LVILLDPALDPSVGTGEDDLDRVSGQPGLRQQRRKGSSCPLSRADRLE
jgi:hypothetical protein